MRPRPFFHRAFECLLINEEDETGKYIFGLCFPIGLADTGRRIGNRVEGEVDGKLERQGRARGRPTGCFAESIKERNEDKRPIYPSTSCCSQKLDEMEKNGNYSPAKEEENDTARRDAARQADRKQQSREAAL